MAGRAEILLLAVLAVVVLLLPQTADVIRGRHMSHTLITAGLVMILVHGRSCWACAAAATVEGRVFPSWLPAS